MSEILVDIICIMNHTSIKFLTHIERNLASLRKPSRVKTFFSNLLNIQNYTLLKAVGGHHQWRWTEPSSLATEQFCIVFNLFEHNPYLDLTYALLKAVGGHHRWRWTEPASLATEQFCIVFNLLNTTLILISLMLFLKRLGVTINGVGRSLHPCLVNSFV